MGPRPQYGKPSWVALRQLQPRARSSQRFSREIEESNRLPRGRAAMKHGTISGYTNHQCRCVECKKAGSEYNAAAYLRRKRGEAPRPRPRGHGTSHHYRVMKCRCDECRVWKRSQGWEKRYGLSLTDVEDLRAKTGGACPICLVFTPTVSVVVDHCHLTGRVRGILCSKCNLVLGKFQESPEIVRSALDYLK